VQVQVLLSAPAGCVCLQFTLPTGWGAFCFVRAFGSAPICTYMTKGNPAVKPGSLFARIAHFSSFIRRAAMKTTRWKYINRTGIPILLCANALKFKGPNLQSNKRNLFDIFYRKK
jgi:hypothetical protein